MYLLLLGLAISGADPEPDPDSVCPVEARLEELEEAVEEQNQDLDELRNDAERLLELVAEDLQADPAEVARALETDDNADIGAAVSEAPADLER